MAPKMDGRDIRRCSLFGPVAQGVFGRVPWLTFGALLVPFGSLLVLFGSLLVPFGSLLVPLASLLRDIFSDITF